MAFKKAVKAVDTKDSAEDIHCNDELKEMLESFEQTLVNYLDTNFAYLDAITSAVHGDKRQEISSPQITLSLLSTTITPNFSSAVVSSVTSHLHQIRIVNQSLCN